MALPTNWNPNHAITAAELEQVLAILRAATVTAQQVNVGTTTSTTYTSTLTGTGGLSVGFTAPPSGKMLITVGARLWNSTNNLHNYISYNLSGASAFTGGDDEAAILFCDASTGFPSEGYTQKTTLRTGLVAGGAYTLTARFKAQGGTMSCANQLLIAQPVT
jgi:hypothetical protein